MGMPSPADHRMMLLALSSHALDLIHRDAREATSLISSYLTSTEQAVILERAKVSNQGFEIRVFSELNLEFLTQFRLDAGHRTTPASNLRSSAPWFRSKVGRLLGMPLIRGAGAVEEAVQPTALPPPSYRDRLSLSGLWSSCAGTPPVRYSASCPPGQPQGSPPPP